MSDIHVLITEDHGVNIPQLFANNHAVVWDNIQTEDLLICQAGPDHPEYWEAWNDILQSAKFTDGQDQIWHIQHEGDLLAYTGDGEEFV